jgi:hypothetical protein
VVVYNKKRKSGNEFEIQMRRKSGNLKVKIGTIQMRHLSNIQG